MSDKVLWYLYGPPASVPNPALIATAMSMYILQLATI